MRIEGSVPIFPTEDHEKVLICVLNLFPESDIRTEVGRIFFSTGSYQRFSIILEEQRIRDTAAMVLRRSLSEDSTRFFLNKQAAFVGRANFTDGNSSLGDIMVEVVEGALSMIGSIDPGR